MFANFGTEEKVIVTETKPIRAMLEPALLSITWLFQR
jgi:hypothetical protein